MYNQNSDLMKQEKFMLPTMIESDFSAEELAEDADGLQMSFPRIATPPAPTGRPAASTMTIPRRFVLLRMARSASVHPAVPAPPAQ